MIPADEAIAAQHSRLRDSGASIGSFVDAWGIEIFTATWRTERPDPLGVIQVVHGIGEHIGRYIDTAHRLTAAGYHVIADDHRGHGATGAHASGDLTRLGFLGPGGLAATIRDVHVVTGLATQLGDGRRPILLGHSWGSFISQHLLNIRSREYDAAILSGSAYCQPGWVRAGRFNRDWNSPTADGHEWLSRDPAVATGFTKDPLTSDITLLRSHGFWDALRLLTRPSPAVRSDLPVLILTGGDDPVGTPGSVERLARAYRDVGLQHVTQTSYPESRHELFNDLDAETVLDDLLAWLGSTR